jgi:Glycoside-hydrolase family GH114
MKNNSLHLVLFLSIIVGIFCGVSGSAFAYTVPTYGTQSAAATVGAVAGAQSPTGGTCGSFGWNLNGCGCNGATAACSIDPKKCPTPQGVYPIAYLNIGRCDSDCPTAGGIGRGGLATSEGGWNEPWINLKSKEGAARTERLIQMAASKGYKAFEPDNTAEKVDVADIKLMVDIGQKYGLKVVIKNEEGTWGKFLAQYPDYKKNIAMILAEDCNTKAGCGAYKKLTDLGIPAVLAGQNQSMLAEMAKFLNAAAMKVSTRSAVGVSTLGQVCLNGAELARSLGPTLEQMSKLLDGGGQSPFNPGGGAWSQNDFSRLQPAATPSYVNPAQPLGPSTTNPYAQQYWQSPQQQPQQSVTGAFTEQPQVPVSRGFVTAVAPSTQADPGESVLTVPTPTNTRVGARLTCAPRVLARGERATLAWRCPVGTVAVGESTDPRSPFVVGGKRYGTVRARAIDTTTYTLGCEVGGDVVEPVSCTVSVRLPMVRSVPDVVRTVDAIGASPVSGVVPEQAQRCFMGFCM